MKKIIFGTLLLLIVTTVVQAQSIHDLSFIDIDGNTVSLSTFSGKKMLVIVAPMTQADSIEIEKLKRFQEAFPADSLLIIGVLSKEDGYLPGNAASIKSLYQNNGVIITLTAGMNTQKTSPGGQSELMNWLTTKSENGRFDTVPRGVMQKYVVGPSGHLLGMAPPAAELFGTIVQILFNRAH